VLLLLLLQVTALSGYLYKFSKDERRVKLQEALAGFAPPRYARIPLSWSCSCCAVPVPSLGRSTCVWSLTRMQQC
jgi:hypothetical protein